MRYLRGLRCAIVLATVGMSLVFVSTALAERKGLAVEPLSFFPKGVVLGMSVGDLQKAKPDARRFHITRDAEVAAEQAGAKPPQVDLRTGTHLFIDIVSAEADFQGASYLVRDGIVMAISIGREWLPSKNFLATDGEHGKPDQASLRTLRAKVLAECTRRLGGHYRIDAVRINQADVVSYLAPRFSWVNGGVGVAVNCTSEYQDVEILRGSVGVATWLVRDDFKPPLPPAEAVDKQVLSRLAEPLVGSAARRN